MSQHDYSLANASGASFRADANDALAAIVSNNSGATAPSTTFAYQWWADTTTGLLKIRNAANSAWITVGTLASTLLGHQAQDATLDTLAALSLVQGDILYATGADTLTRLAKGTASQVLRMNSGATAPEWYTPTTVAEAYIYLREEQASGTHGGTFTSGAWQKRTLNTEVNDAGGHASIASSVITLAAGTYRFRARAPAYAVAAHQVRLANTSDSTYFYGSSCLAPVGASHQGDSVVSGRFTIASSKNFELQHRCGTTSSTYGFGNAGSFGGVEVYAEIEFWKEA